MGLFSQVRRAIGRGTSLPKTRVSRNSRLQRNKSRRGLTNRKIQLSHKPRRVRGIFR